MPGVLDHLGDVAGPAADEEFEETLRQVFEAVSSVGMRAAMGGITPDWAVVRELYQEMPDKQQQVVPVVAEGEWIVVDQQAGSFGRAVDLGVISDAIEVGRIVNGRGVATVDGKPVLVARVDQGARAIGAATQQPVGAVGAGVAGSPGAGGQAPSLSADPMARALGTPGQAGAPGPFVGPGHQEQIGFPAMWSPGQVGAPGPFVGSGHHRQTGGMAGMHLGGLGAQLGSAVGMAPKGGVQDPFGGTSHQGKGWAQGGGNDQVMGQYPSSMGAGWPAQGGGNGQVMGQYPAGMGWPQYGSGQTNAPGYPPMQQHAGGWGLFAGTTGIKPGHIPNAASVLDQIGSGSGGGPASARAYVTSVYNDIRGGAEYQQLTTHATMLDLRVQQIMAMYPMAPRSFYESDPQIEVLASEMAAIHHMLATGNALGANEMRAVLGTERHLAAPAARAAALGAAKEAHKLEEYKKTIGRLPVGRTPAGGGRGGARGPGQTAPARDGVNPQLECHRCGERGHPARLCTAAAPAEKAPRGPARG